MKKSAFVSLLLVLPLLAACQQNGYEQDASDATNSPIATDDFDADMITEADIESSFPDDIPPPPPPPPLTPENIAGFEDLPPEVQEDLRRTLEAEATPTETAATTDTE